MSVQKVNTNVSLSTICPLVVRPEDNIFLYQSALGVSLRSNVNSGFSSCFPNDYAFLQVYTQNQVNKCCTYDPSLNVQQQLVADQANVMLAMAGYY
jgi:hypothetical protein